MKLTERPTEEMNQQIGLFLHRNSNASIISLVSVMLLGAYGYMVFKNHLKKLCQSVKGWSGKALAILRNKSERKEKREPHGSTF